MDNKYGRIFTENDVKIILKHVYHDASLESALEELGNGGWTPKFKDDLPIFVLIASDKRALGAVRYYRDHQSPRAPMNHLDSIDRAYDAFADYAIHRETKEPD